MEDYGYANTAGSQIKASQEPGMVILNERLAKTQARLADISFRTRDIADGIFGARPEAVGGVGDSPASPGIVGMISEIEQTISRIESTLGRF